MWQGDIKKGSWGLELELEGDKEELELIMREVAGNTKISMRSVSLIAGTCDEKDKRNQYVELADELDSD